MLSLAKESIVETMAHSLKQWIFVAVLIYSTNAFPDSSGERKMNLRIGFDLTQGENGAPSLRIRDFEDSSDFNQRAVDEDAQNTDKKTSPSVRADSFSGSSETFTNNVPARYVESSKERDRSDDKSDDDSNDSDRRISTRGLVPEEYEPEENPRVHPKYQESSESDSDRPHNRRKRHIRLKGLLENIKKKSKEFFDAERRQGASTP